MRKQKSDHEIKLDDTSDHINKEQVRVRRERPVRKMNDKQGPLSFPEIPGYRTYVAVFTGDQFDYQMLKLFDKGYEPALRKDIDLSLEEQDPSIANSKVIFPTGKDTKGILLKIPQEWWTEDYEKEVSDNMKHFKKNIAPIKKEFNETSSMHSVEDSLSVKTNYKTI